MILVGFTRVIALFLVVIVASQGAGIQLKTRRLDPAGDQRAYLSVPIKRRHFGRSHLLLQFDRPVEAQTIDELRDRGAVVISSVPENGLMISAADDFSTDGLGIRWVGRLWPEDKISPAAGNEMGLDGPAAQTYLVEFHSDVAADDARAMLSEHNLITLDHPDLLDNHQLVSGSFADISRLSEWDEVSYILPASADLFAGNPVSGCAGALTQSGAVANYVKVSRGWPAEPGGGTELNYVFGELTTNIAASVSQAQIAGAFQEWAKYGRLRFTPGTDARGPHTINILFASGAHGDSYPFDGPGKVLAHTFYPAPPNPEPIAGDMHLDADERWQVGADVDLFTVALHEAGHALGLGHSDQPGAVMYPYYRRGAKLSADDIAGIQDLYGPTEGPPAAPPPAAPIPPAVPKPALGLSVQNPAVVSLTTTASTLAFSGTTMNGTGEVHVTWRTDQNVSGAASGSATWAVGSISLHADINQIVITAADSANRTASVTITVTRQSTAVDRTPPSLTIISPAANTSSSQSAQVTLRGVAADNVGVVLITWSVSSGASGVAAGTANWIAADIPLQSGSNSITVRAFDAARNSAWRSAIVVRR